MELGYKTLLQKVQIQFGERITDVKGLKLLREDIINQTEKEISYSTLRRLFGFLPYREPSINTLNILSIYTGYKNYTQFRRKEVPGSWVNFLKVNRLKSKETLDDDDIQFLCELNTSFSFSHYFLDLFHYYLFQRNIKVLNQLFQAKILNIEWSEQLRISVAVGMAIRDTYKDGLHLTKQLLENDIFRREYFYNFIDYDNITRDYAQLLEYCLIIEKESIHRIFIQTMLVYGQFLNNKKPSSLPNLLEDEYQALFPVVKGRYLAYSLFNTSREEQDDMYDSILEAAIEEENKALFFYEIIPVLILLQRIDLIEKTFQLHYEDIFEISFFSAYTQQNIFQIGLALISLKHGKKQQAKRELALVDLEVVMDSYLHYIEVFYLLIYYQVAPKNQQTTIKDKYLQLVKQFKLGIFTEKLLLNYQIELPDS